MIREIFIVPIRLYQVFISPFLGKSCRFEPTCSTYAMESIKMHGIIRGISDSMVRISKCHPWGKSGFDPVKK